MARREIPVVGDSVRSQVDTHLLSRLEPFLTGFMGVWLLVAVTWFEVAFIRLLWRVVEMLGSG